MDKTEQAIRHEVNKWIIKSFFKRLTFKRSWWSNVKLIFRCAGTWRMRYQEYLRIHTVRLNTSLKIRKRNIKTLSPKSVGEERYLELLDSIEEERENHDPTYH